jgi:hypothetical protein
VSFESEFFSASEGIQGIKQCRYYSGLHRKREPFCVARKILAGCFSEEAEAYAADIFVWMLLEIIIRRSEEGEYGSHWQ